MAKKIKKIIIAQQYFDLLRRKEELFDELVNDDGGVSIGLSALKELGKIGKVQAKIDSGAADLYKIESYDPPKPDKG